ncbi:MAG: hypothetical protein ACRDZN_15395 [Acidimicrobiales bacterium]
MNKKRRRIAAVTVMTLALGGGVGTAFASDDGDGGGLPEVCRERPPGTAAQIATAKLIIEFNATDGDLGVHGAFDDHGWSELCVFDPSGRPIVVVDPRRQLNDLTMAGIFFESREPPVSEFSMADLAAAFPEGRYGVRGKSFDGTVLKGRATFTHDVPAPPTITAPKIADEPEQTGRPLPRADFAVAWEPVTETVTGEPVTISGYEVIITKEVEDDPHGFSRPTYDVHVPPTQHSLSVPKEFLEAGTVYELEVLALERSGNQTISVGFFKTR